MTALRHPRSSALLAVLSLSAWSLSSPLLAQPAPRGVVLFSPPPPPGAIPPPVVGAGTQAAAAAEETEAAEPEGIAGWFPDEGFVIKSRDEQYALRVGFQGGYRLSPYWRDGVSQDRKQFFVIRPLIYWLGFI
jgi:hypothetical protein